MIGPVRVPTSSICSEVLVHAIADVAAFAREQSHVPVASPGSVSKLAT